MKLGGLSITPPTGLSVWRPRRSGVGSASGVCWGRGAGRLGSQGPPLSPRVLGCPVLPASPFPYTGLLEKPQA